MTDGLVTCGGDGAAGGSAPWRHPAARAGVVLIGGGSLAVLGDVRRARMVITVDWSVTRGVGSGQVVGIAWVTISQGP